MTDPGYTQAMETPTRCICGADVLPRAAVPLDFGWRCSYVCCGAWIEDVAL